MSLLQKIEEKRNRQIKKDKNKKIAIATAGVATGAVVGTIAGVLIAPKSGKETIEDVKEKSNQVKNKINENIEDTKFKVKESKDKIKEYLAKRKNEKSENEIVEIEPLQLIENTEVAEEKYRGLKCDHRFKDKYIYTSYIMLIALNYINNNFILI